jgi:hypothetical protein
MSRSEKWSSPTMSKVRFTIAIGLALTGFSGCASWTTPKSGKKESVWSSMQFWKKPYQKPQKMAAIWSPDVLTMSGKAPTRGFGGRIYFYNDKSQAVPVDGELVIHGYTEKRIGSRPQSEQVEADKTFVFNAEQFTNHFSPSDMGASYSIWIPWDAAGGIQSEITLIPTFKGTDGALVQGEPAKLVLPGKKKEEEIPAATPFQNASFQQASGLSSGNVATDNPALRTTTIAIPARTQRHDRDVIGTQNEYGLPAPVTVSTRASGLSQPVDPARAMVYGGTPQAARTLTLAPPSLPTAPNIPVTYPGLPGAVQVPNGNPGNDVSPATQVAPSGSPQVSPLTYPVGPTYPSAPVYQPAPGFQPRAKQPSGGPPQSIVPPGTATPSMPLPAQANVMTPVAQVGTWQPFGQATPNAFQGVAAGNVIQPAGFNNSPSAAGQAQSPVQSAAQRNQVPNFLPAQPPIYSR